VKKLYDTYGYKFKKVSELVEFISKKLDLSSTIVLQILQNLI